MAGPVPAIHDLCRRPENVDARDTGHDECVATAAIPSLTQNAADVAVRRICPL